MHEIKEEMLHKGERGAVEQLFIGNPGRNSHLIVSCGVARWNSKSISDAEASATQRKTGETANLNLFVHDFSSLAQGKSER